MVIISTRAVAVSIHAVSPVSNLGAAAGAGVAAAWASASAGRSSTAAAPAPASTELVLNFIVVPWFLS